MKLNLNKKYTSIAIYACIVILFTLVCIYFVIHPENLRASLNSIWAIISPIVGGAILAYIICPIMNFFERKVFISKDCRRARKQAKEQAHKNRITSKHKVEKLMHEASERVMAEKHLQRLNGKSKRKGRNLLDRMKPVKPKKLHYGNRALSLVCTYLLLLAIISAVIYVVIPQIINSINDIIVNIKNIADSIPSYVAMLSEKYAWFDEAYEMAKGHFSLNDLISLLKNLLSNSLNYIKLATDIFSSVFTQVKNIVLIIIFSIYFLIYKEYLGKQANTVIDALVKPKGASYIRHLTKEFNVRFGQYLQGQILDSCLIAVISFIVFGICDIPYYQLISIVIGITNIIPVFGPFIGAIPSALIIFIAEPSKVILFVVLILIMQQIDGNVIIPRILGTTVGLKPIWIIIAIIIMGGLFGFFGMFFGVPIFAVIYTIISEQINKKLAIKYASQVVADTESVDFIKFLNDKDVKSEAEADGD